MRGGDTVLKDLFGEENKIEIRNHSNRPIWVRVIKGIFRTYVEVGLKKKEIGGDAWKVSPNDYEIVEIEPEFEER